MPAPSPDPVTIRAPSPYHGDALPNELSGHDVRTAVFNRATTARRRTLAARNPISSLAHHDSDVD